MQPHEMHEIDGADPQQNDRSGVSLEKRPCALDVSRGKFQLLAVLKVLGKEQS